MYMYMYAYLLGQAVMIVCCIVWMYVTISTNSTAQEVTGLQPIEGHTCRYSTRMFQSNSCQKYNLLVIV